jgi:hypothetical protein
MKGKDKTMRSILKRRARTRRLAVLLAVGALAVAAPVSGAGAAVSPFSFFGGAGFPAYTSGFAGPTTGLIGPAGGAFNLGVAGTTNTGCGQSRPSVFGGTGSSEQISCGSVLSFIGPSIGAINSQVGPTIIGSTVLGPVTVSAGNTIVNAIP